MGTREVAAEPPTRWASADDGLDGVRERLALAMDRTGQSRRSLATAGGFDRQAVGRFLSSERVPSASVFIAIAGTLGVSLEWLLTGKGPETLGAMEHIGQALPGFLVRLNESGLGSWASRQPPTSTPTLAEAVKALEDMQAAHDRGEPFYTNEGVPVIRWAEYFVAQRAGKAGRVPSKKTLGEEGIDPAPKAGVPTPFVRLRKVKKST